MKQRQSIRYRFSTVFLAVMGVVGVLGAFSIWRLKDYYTFSAEIRDRYFQNTQYIGDLNNFTSDFRAAEATRLLAVNQDEQARNEHERADLDGRIAEARDHYLTIRHDAAEAELFAQFQARWETYRDVANRVLTISLDDRRTDAIALYMTQSRSAYDAASDTLGELTVLNAANARQAALRADQAYRAARQLTALAVGFAGLAVFASLVYMRRQIADPLLALARCMRRLAGNEIDGDIPAVDRDDEIGDMARSVLVFRDSVIDLAINQRALSDQASLLAEKLAAEQHLTQLQRNFVSMASHEFRTPLTIIDAHAQRLVRAKDRLTADEIAERGGRIRAAVLRITNVIENMIESARLLEGDAELYVHRVLFDMGDMLHEVCRLHREVVPRARIVENITVRGHIISGDRKLLFQAFSNIISNAIKYSPDGGLIIVKSVLNGKNVEVTVEDHGIGIPEADRGRLFERYFRGHNVSGIVGTGVGLYLVKTVIDLHGGEIAVDSQEGTGATFVVRLPIGPSPGIEANSRLASASGSRIQRPA